MHKKHLNIKYSKCQTLSNKLQYNDFSQALFDSMHGTIVHWALFGLIGR